MSPAVVVPHIVMPHVSVPHVASPHVAPPHVTPYVPHPFIFSPSTGQPARAGTSTDDHTAEAPSLTPAVGVVLAFAVFVSFIALWVKSYRT